MIYLKQFAFFLLVLFFQNALSMSASERDVENCIAKTSGTTNDMVLCTDNEIKKLETLKLGLLDSLKKHLDTSQIKTLDNSESKWLDYRNTFCKVFFGEATGTIAHVQSISCALSLTEERISQLESLKEDVSL